MKSLPMLSEGSIGEEIMSTHITKYISLRENKNNFICFILAQKDNILHYMSVSLTLKVSRNLIII